MLRCFLTLALAISSLASANGQEPSHVLQRLRQKQIEVKETTFHQFRQLEFENRAADGSRGTNCRIVEPRISAPGNPWIWRARFFGHQPALDLQLLERGFHLAYCDVANLYGSPEAVARWDDFYQLAQELNLHPKPILEGMSRGGLIIFNWAKKNPGKVAAIYGDNPVCDIRSWPKKKSEADWKRCQAAWGLNGQTELDAFQGNPIDGLEGLAKANVPVYLVVGDSDEVVPPDENATVLMNRYRQWKGPIEQWLKPDQGHHPHGLHPPDALTQRLIQATLPPDPTPKAVRKKKLESAKQVLFLGDSITFAGGYVIDFETWCMENKCLQSASVNAGLPSETVSGLSENGHAGGRFPRPDLHERLKRVLDQVQPDLVFACYGMNCGIYQPLDQARFESFRQGIVTLKEEVESRGSKIIFLTSMPYDSLKPHPYQATLQFYNYWLLAQRANGWHVVDVHFELTRVIADMRRTEPGFTFQKDKVHPNWAGHREMARVLVNYFSDPKLETLTSDWFQKNRPGIAKAARERRDDVLKKTGHLRPGTPGYRK